MCSRDQAILILGEVYSACNPIFGYAIKDTYLYGSYARGDYHEESDIDILLAVDMDQSAIAVHRNSIGRPSKKQKVCQFLCCLTKVNKLKRNRHHEADFFLGFISI